MKKVAIYARVSTTLQAEEGYSVEQQIERLTKYAELNEWTISKIYKDAGFSGAKLARPAMQQLINDIPSKNFDTVLVYKLDRLSRSVKDTLYLTKEVFNKNNIAFVSLNENIDTSSAMGSLFLTILSAINEFERENIKERMTMGKLGRIKSGKTSAWSNAPFGYDYIDGHLVQNEIQAAVVREIFEDYLNGYSLSKIKKKLNENGHIGKETEWNFSRVRQVLENIIHAGYNTFKGENYKGTHEPIISYEKWLTVQEELAKRQKEAYSKYNNPRPFQSKYLLSGLVRCGYCNSTLELRFGVPRKDGTRLKRYQCKSTIGKMKREDKCPAALYDMETLENTILQKLEDYRVNSDLIDELFSEDTSKHDELEREALEKEIKESDKKLSKLVDLYLNGTISSEILDEKKIAIEHDKDMYLSKLKKLKDSTSKENKVIKFNSILEETKSSIFELSYDQQKQIVRSLINSIILKGDAVRIEWLFN